VEDSFGWVWKQRKHLILNLTGLANDTSLNKWISQEHVEGNPIMLYMKGNPSMPMCGFSARVVQTLQSEGVDFSSVNVLDYPDIREGIKKFS